MKATAVQWLGRSLVTLAVAGALAGCAEGAPLGPDRPAVQADVRAPDLGSSCEHLQVQAGSVLAVRLYAKGVQIYRWNGTSWSFVAPSAELFADAGGSSTVGSHYAGPTWESVSGSKVVGTVLQRCTPDPTAVQWLLLGAVSNEAPGVFQNVTFIQRVNTVGGIAPSAPGSFTGEEARVAYTTEYLFYVKQ